MNTDLVMDCKTMSDFENANYLDCPGIKCELHIAVSVGSFYEIAMMYYEYTSLSQWI